MKFAIAWFAGCAVLMFVVWYAHFRPTHDHAASVQEIVGTAAQLEAQLEAAWAENRLLRDSIAALQTRHAAVPRLTCP